MKKNHQFRIAIVLSTIALLVAALVSCAGNKGNQPPTTSGYVSAFGSANAAGIPAECAGQQIMVQVVTPGVPQPGDMWSEVRCSCPIGGDLIATWYNTVRVGQDPNTVCYGYTVVVHVPASSAESIALPPDSGVVPDASIATALPPLPTVLPFSLGSATASASAVVPPLPVPDASAPLPDAHSDLRISDKRYQCDGKAAMRTGKLVTESGGQRNTTAVAQQCVGDNIACLTKPADKLDFNKPPCGCKSGFHPDAAKDNDNTWMCIAD